MSFDVLWECIEKRTNQLIQNLNDKKEEILMLKSIDGKSSDVNPAKCNDFTYKSIENQISIIVEYIGIASSTNKVLETELASAREAVTDLKTTEKVLTVEEQEMHELEIQALKGVNSHLENILRKRTKEYNDLKNLLENRKIYSKENEDCQSFEEAIKDSSYHIEPLNESNSCHIVYKTQNRIPMFCNNIEYSSKIESKSNTETEEPETNSDRCEPKSSSQERRESSVGLLSEEEFLLPDI